MKKSIFRYLLFTAFIFLGAFGLAETEYFTIGQALLRATTIFVIFNIFLILRFAFGALKKFLYKREMKNPKYKELNREE
jgi:hypothetical protein